MISDALKSRDQILKVLSTQSFEPHSDVRQEVRDLVYMSTVGYSAKRVTWPEYETLYLNGPERRLVYSALDNDALGRVASRVAQEISRWCGDFTYESCLCVDIVPEIVRRLR